MSIKEVESVHIQQIDIENLSLSKKWISGLCWLPWHQQNHWLYIGRVFNMSKAFDQDLHWEIQDCRYQKYELGNQSKVILFEFYAIFRPPRFHWHESNWHFLNGILRLIKFSIEILMEDVNLIVTEVYHFENRDESSFAVLYRFFGLSEFWCKKQRPILTDGTAHSLTKMYGWLLDQNFEPGIFAEKWLAISS